MFNVYILPAIQTAATLPLIGGFFAWLLTWEGDKVFVLIVAFFSGFIGSYLAFKKRTKKEEVPIKTEVPVIIPESPSKTPSDYDKAIEDIRAKVAALEKEKAAE